MNTLFVELLEVALSNVKQGMNKVEFTKDGLKVSVYRISDKQIRIDLIEER